MEEKHHLSKNAVVVAGVVMLGGLLFYAYQYGRPDEEPTVQVEGIAEELPFTVSHTPAETILEQGDIEQRAITIIVSPNEGFEGTLAFSVEDILTEAGESIINDNYLPAYFPFSELEIQQFGAPIENQLILVPTPKIPLGNLSIIYAITSNSGEGQTTFSFSIPITVR